MANVNYAFYIGAHGFAEAVFDADITSTSISDSPLPLLDVKSHININRTLPVTAFQFLDRKLAHGPQNPLKTHSSCGEIMGKPRNNFTEISQHLRINIGEIFETFYLNFGEILRRFWSDFKVVLWNNYSGAISIYQWWWIITCKGNLRPYALPWTDNTDNSLKPNTAVLVNL